MHLTSPNLYLNPDSWQQRKRSPFFETITVISKSLVQLSPWMLLPHPDLPVPLLLPRGLKGTKSTFKAMIPVEKAEAPHPPHTSLQTNPRAPVLPACTEGSCGSWEDRTGADSHTGASTPPAPTPACQVAGRGWAPNRFPGNPSKRASALGQDPQFWVTSHRMENVRAFQFSDSG